MQNDYIYALFSYQLYDNARNYLPVGWESFNGSFSSLTPQDDFYAYSYINKSIKKIIIAFRGTQTLENLLKEDIFEIAFNKPPSLFVNNAVPYVEAVCAQALNQYPDFEISFTGHSLGAILAELCAAKYTMQAVTFESPGSGAMIVDLSLKQLLPLDAPVTAETNIISYQAAISSINRHNPYLGKRIRLYPDPPLIDPFLVSYEYATPFINPCGSMDIPAPHIFGQYSTQQHHMKALLAEFDPEEGALVYSIYPPLEQNDLNHGYTFAYKNWLDYDANPYYWDKAIEEIYYPVCGYRQTLQAYKENYIKRRLHRNINADKQVGIMINAPGSSRYPALTVWGTTSGKDTLIFGRGKFKVIAYGFNTYQFTRDVQVSCDVEQMTLDSHRESIIFIGDQEVQGYALNYNTPLKFKPIFYLSSGMKAPGGRSPGETTEAHLISIDGHVVNSDSDFVNNFPAIRFSYSPSSQFTILAGEAYQYHRAGWLAAFSKMMIYNLTIGLNKNYWNVHQQPLTGFSETTTAPTLISAFSLPEAEKFTRNVVFITIADLPKQLWMMEKILVSVQVAGAQGVMIAVSEAASVAAVQAGYSDSAALKVSQLVYYVSIFCIQVYLNYYQNKSTASCASTWEEAADIAAQDIVVLFALNMMLAGLKHIVDCVSKKCEQRQWLKTNEILKQINETLKYVSYGYRLYKESAVETAAALATGVATQKVTELTCQRGVSSFFKSQCKSVSSRKDSHDIEKQSSHQPLISREKRQKNYHSVFETASPASKILFSQSVKSSPDQERQQSAFIALSIYNKKSVRHMTAQTVNVGMKNKKLCAVM